MAAGRSVAFVRRSAARSLGLVWRPRSPRSRFQGACETATSKGNALWLRVNQRKKRPPSWGASRSLFPAWSASSNRTTGWIGCSCAATQPHRERREWTQRPSSANLRTLRIARRNRDQMLFRLQEVIRALISDSQHPRGQTPCRHQIDDRYAGPHKRTGALLILQNRHAETVRCREIHRIDHTLREHKEPGKNVARKRCQK